jgi:hypothetical protein
MVITGSDGWDIERLDELLVVASDDLLNHRCEPPWTTGVRSWYERRCSISLMRSHARASTEKLSDFYIKRTERCHTDRLDQWLGTLERRRPDQQVVQSTRVNVLFMSNRV